MGRNAKEPNTPVKPAIVSDDKQLTVSSNQWYHVLEDRVARNDFGHVDHSPWPVTLVDQGNTKGTIELRPLITDQKEFLSAEELAFWVPWMWAQRDEFGDLDVDVMDCMINAWLDNAAKDPSTAVTIDVDRICEMRGLQRKSSGNGRRGGFYESQRMAVLKSVFRLQTIVINAESSNVIFRDGAPKIQGFQERPWIIQRLSTERDLINGAREIRSIDFHVGRSYGEYLAGPGKQTAELSIKALRYNPDTQPFEKRLVRYLCYQWRVRARGGNYEQPFRVSTLLDNIGMTTDGKAPSRVRERFEKALDTLLADKVIAAWEYKDWDEQWAERRGWLNLWLQANVKIAPPEKIPEIYKGIQANAPATAPGLLPESTATLGEQIRKARRARKLSQAKVAEALGVDQTYVSKLELGHRQNMSKDVYERIVEWVRANS